MNNTRKHVYSIEEYTVIKYNMVCMYMYTDGKKKLCIAKKINNSKSMHVMIMKIDKHIVHDTNI